MHCAPMPGCETRTPLSGSSSRRSPGSPPVRPKRPREAPHASRILRNRTGGRRSPGVAIALAGLIAALSGASTPTWAEGFLILTRDINPGPESSFAEYLTDVDGTLFFVASMLNPSGFFFDTRLWVSNGTPDGTVMLDGNPASRLTADSPSDLVNVDGTLFFSAEGRDTVSDPNRSFGRELWRSDGSRAGTIMVRDIFPGFAGSFPRNLAAVNGKVFFTATGPGDTGDELWVSDGLPGGATFMVKDIRPGRPSSLGKISAPVNVDGTLFFWADDGVHGFELWKSDGTRDGTKMVKDINATAPGASAAPFDPNPFVIIGSRAHRFFDPISVGGTLFFTADDGVHGVELWRSDGTAGGTLMVADLDPRPGVSSTPAWLTEVNGTLYFTADDGVKGRELFRSDGHLTGTRRVADIWPGTGSSRDLGSHDMLANVEGTLFFAAKDGRVGTALWRSDGTEAGTSMVIDLHPGTNGFAPIGKLTALNGSLFFAASDGVDGVELWQSDGTAGRTRKTDVNAGPGSSIALITGPRGIDLVTSGNRLFLPATDGGPFGGELWVTAAVVPDGLDPTRTRPLGGDPPPPAPGADLGVTVLSDPDVVQSDGLFTYVYRITNKGPEVAVDVRLSDILNPEVSFVAANPLCSFGVLFVKFVSCQIGNLPSGQSVQVWATLGAPTVTAAIRIEDDARVSSAAVDPNPLDNRGFAFTTVNPPPPPPPLGSADLSVLKLDGRDPVLPGGDVEYTLTVINNGPSDATGVTLTDPLPVGVSFQSVASDPLSICTEESGTLTCLIGALGNGAVAEVQVRATVPGTSGALHNTASVMADQVDPDPSNNSATEDTVVGVPEPGPWALAVALGMLGALGRRRGSGGRPR